MINPFRLFVIALATWRVSSMLVQEDGAFKVFSRLRKRSTFGGLLECIWCLSVWIAPAILACERVAPIAVDMLAVSAAAIAVDKVVS